MATTNMTRKRYRINWPVFISRLILIALVAVSAVWGGQYAVKAISLAATTDGDSIMAPTSSVVVEPGDSLWSIASRIGTTQGVDTRRIVDDIKVLNGLASAGTLRPGTTLIVPSDTIEPDVVLASNERECEGKKRT